MVAVSFLAHMSLMEGSKQREKKRTKLIPEEEFQGHVFKHERKVPF